MVRSPLISFILLVLFGSSLCSVRINLEKVGKSGASRGFVTLNGTEYYVSPPEIEVDFPGAISLCIDANMTLVGLETQQEINIITDYLNTQNYTDSFWTSGIYVDGYFMWSNTGTVFTDTYSGWSSTPTKSCSYLVTVRGSATNGLLTESATSPWYGVICERNQ